jgi:hypothetical protein
MSRVEALRSDQKNGGSIAQGLWYDSEIRKAQPDRDRSLARSSVNAEYVYFVRNGENFSALSVITFRS